MLGFQVPRAPERSLRRDDGERVERIMRAWSGPDWPRTADFAEAAGHNRRAMQISTVAHCSMEYYRWAVRSQFRTDGARFAKAVSAPTRVPVLQVHGADDPCVLDRTMRACRDRAAGEFTHRALPGVGHFPHQERPAETIGADRRVPQRVVTATSAVSGLSENSPSTPASRNARYSANTSP